MSTTSRAQPRRYRGKDNTYQRLVDPSKCRLIFCSRIISLRLHAPFVYIEQVGHGCPTCAQKSTLVTEDGAPHSLREAPASLQKKKIKWSDNAPRTNRKSAAAHPVPPTKLQRGSPRQAKLPSSPPGTARADAAPQSTKPQSFTCFNVLLASVFHRLYIK